MEKYLPLLFLVFVIGAFYVNIIGLLNMLPRIITLPLLFLSIYLFVYSLVYRKTFKGFKKAR